MVLTGRVAARLSRPLVDILRRAHADGVRLDDELVAAVSAIERAGREYAASRVRASSVDGTAPVESAELAAGSVSDGLSTAEVANRLGCGERNVTKLLAQRRLTGRQVGRAWLVDADSVARILDDRDSSSA